MNSHQIRKEDQNYPLRTKKHQLILHLSFLDDQESSYPDQNLCNMGISGNPLSRVVQNSTPSPCSYPKHFRFHHSSKNRSKV